MGTSRRIPSKSCTVPEAKMFQFRLLACCTLLCVAESAVFLTEGASKDSLSARREIPAQAFELPAVKTLELLRSTPIHDLEACAIKGFCPQRLTDLLTDFSSHKGAVELIDSLSANF